MDKKTTAYVKSALRRIWGRSKQKQAALKAAKTSYGHYKCENCEGIFRKKEINVDHIIAIGKFVGFSQFIERLFCESKYLQILCVPCHKIKSKKDIKK